MSKKVTMYEAVDTQRKQIRQVLMKWAPQQVQRFDVFCQQFKFEVFNSGLVLGAVGATVVLMILWWISGVL